MLTFLKHLFGFIGNVASKHVEFSSTPTAINVYLLLNKEVIVGMKKG